MIHDQEARSSFPSSKTDFMMCGKKLFRQRAYCVDRGYKIFFIFLMMLTLMMMMRKQGLPICHLLPWLAGLRDLLHPVPPKHLLVGIILSSTRSPWNIFDSRRSQLSFLSSFKPGYRIYLSFASLSLRT